MTACTTTPLTATKACSGKCTGGGACGNKTPRVWVAAACDGMISLFEKNPDGHLALLAGQERAIFSSMEDFQHALLAADNHKRLDQLVLVGAKGDIAWVHTALPTGITTHIAAEIEYSLMPGWFKQPPQLAHVLERVFAA